MSNEQGTGITLETLPRNITEGGIVRFVTTLTRLRTRSTLELRITGGDIEKHIFPDPSQSVIAVEPDRDDDLRFEQKWDTSGRRPGVYTVTVTLAPTSAAFEGQQWTTSDTVTITESLRQRSIPITANVVAEARMQRAAQEPTKDQALWKQIRNASEALSYNAYEEYVQTAAEWSDATTKGLPRGGSALLNGVDAYQKLKAITESFLVSRGGLLGPDDKHPQSALSRYLERDDVTGKKELPLWRLYLRRFPDLRITRDGSDIDSYLEQALQEKLRQWPCVELLWSYWQEESGLVQALNRISQRFQNVRSMGDKDPLANLEISHLRPLSNLLWGFVQDDIHRLSVVRRAYEYAHAYGFTLEGKAVSNLRTADARSKFVESFHTLLAESVQFFRRDDDTTVLADAFPLLNCIKELHYMLAEGANNQFGDLPTTARQEMLIQQWLLGRPEMREFLGGRTLPYTERWMDKLDAMKKLMGWSDVSVVHFHDLAVHGERILLSVRYGKWSEAELPEQAANWARAWRPEIQNYIHAYRAVTGVDVSAPVTDLQSSGERYWPPSRLIRNRLAQQRAR